MALNLNGYDALKRVDAQSESANEDNRGVGGDESVSELLSRDIFSDYRSRSVSRGRTHPGAIAEAASLRCPQLNQMASHLMQMIAKPARAANADAWTIHETLVLHAVPSPSLRVAIHCGTVSQRRQLRAAS